MDNGAAKATTGPSSPIHGVELEFEDREPSR
jgi:hypothetical protein